MTRAHSVHRCQVCASVQPRWAGRCPGCGEWGSLVEEVAPGPTGAGRGAARAQAAVEGCEPQALLDVDLEGRPPLQTGVPEFDRALSGGLLPGSSTLLGGEPGTGKSTLLLQVLASMARSGRRGLLVAAEEAAHQVKRRAGRLGADLPGLFVLETGQLPAVELAIARLAPDVVVVDSVQAVTAPDVASPAGSVAQVRECALALVAAAKAAGTALVLVGHVTKDGALAGPRALEHLVDTVLSFEGDRYSSLRALRAVKHRFGPTGETGLFEMGDRGLVGVPDPSALFLGDRLPGSSGSAVAVTMEGHRPVLVEVQALLGPQAPNPRRLVSGAGPARVGFLVAVLTSRAGLPLGGVDVYVSVTGGAQATEPAADLAICLALASAWSGRPVPADLVAVGEVGLGGEVRRASAMPKRLAEAARLGFARALVPGAHRGSACPAPAVTGMAGEIGAGVAPLSTGLRPGGGASHGAGPNLVAPVGSLVALSAPTLRHALALAFEGQLPAAPGSAVAKRRPSPAAVFGARPGRPATALDGDEAVPWAAPGPDDAEPWAAPDADEAAPWAAPDAGRAAI